MLLCREVLCRFVCVLLSCAVVVPRLASATTGIAVQQQEYVAGSDDHGGLQQDVQQEGSVLSQGGRAKEAEEVIKVFCDEPYPPENGYVKRDNYTQNAVVYLFCETGYILNGPRRLTCLPDNLSGTPGVWHPKEEYMCTPAERRSRREVAQFENVLCPEPTAPDHGQVHGTDRSMGATIKYTCDPGYVLNGPDRATCLAVPDPFNHVAIWDPPLVPTCQGSPPSALPLDLMPDSSSKDSVIVRVSSYRLTDSVPNPNQVEGLPSFCSLPKMAGPCQEALLHYYFDTKALECLPFTYGGCEGNDNNFETFQDCQDACR